MSDDKITVFGLADRAGWEAATAGPDAMPSHDWAYAAGLAVAGIEPQLAVVEADGARMILPFFERRWNDTTDIATLPGLSGAVIPSDGAAPLSLWRDYAAERGWVCGYLQISVTTTMPAVAPPDRVQAHNALYVFDLTDWDIHHSLGHNMRKTYRRATRDGVAFTTDQSRLAAAFPALHVEAMARAGEGPVFPVEVLSHWAKAANVVFIGGELDGEIVVAGMCRKHGPMIEGHLAGSTEAGRGLHAWMFLESAQWFAQQGALSYNIGGYGRPGDGLHLMKSRLGAIEHPLRSLCQIYRPDLFSELCRDAGADPQARYFPPYRAGSV
ncbi:hypothetical protein [Flavimaricola marinus]|uniref:FemAB family protein n=1 Tax=Flavimaricola marinus TaxID=1819565 RepID=A0A238LEH9_9RHOB|nr:hypothetical protein [Flavimaricola marinus]SMY07366.1 hypothetical protein LOM8899_01501 [Flavimaricola marinus]